MKKLFTLWLALLFGLVANAQTKFVKSVPTLTELRALNVADIHTNVLVNSYWTSNTNSVGALFQWVPGATDATNTTSVFAPASGTGRWIRVELPANPGSATQPGFRFLGDDNTGIYNSGADAIDFSTGGSRRWGITSAGILQSQGAQTISSSSSTLTLQPVGSLIVSPNSSEAMRVLTTGAVGIGTTGPDKKLDVLDASNAQLRLSQADGTVYTDIGTISAGHTLITNSYGTRTTSTTVNDTSILARQVQGGIAFDGVTTTAKDVHTIGADIGTGDFTYSTTLLCPTSTDTPDRYIFDLTPSSTTIAAPSKAGASFLVSSGKLQVYVTGTTYPGVSKYCTMDVSGVITAYGGKIINISVVRSSGVGYVYINGILQTTTDTSSSGGSFADTVTSTYLIPGGIATGNNGFKGSIFSAQLFNRALSASEVITLANQGVSEADKWGSLTASYTSDFTAGASPNPQNNWTALAGTVTGDIDGIGSPSTDDTLRYWADGTSANHGPRITTINLTANKRYRVRWSYFIPSGNTTLKRVAIYGQSGATFSGSVVQTVTGTWTDVVSEGYLASTQGIAFLGLTSASSGVWVGANSVTDDLLYIKNVVVTQIGSILDADLSAGVGYQVPDRSSNKYHGVVSASGTSWTQANRRGQIRYTTTGATTGAFQLLSSTAIPANALIQSIVAWSAGTPLIYVGTATGTSNIVGHTTLVGSTYTPLTLSSQFSTTGNLWINKSATNEVNLTVNYMIADP